MQKFPYRDLRPGNILTPAYRHVLLLLYWPVYGFFFLFVERIYKVDGYFPMWCPLDDKIPFCEYFFIPYMFWFVYLIGMLAYTFFCDTDAFSRMMWFIIICDTTAIIIYLIFPTCQELRPVDFPRDNALTSLVRAFYSFDTNTNVFPSIHVLNTVAVMAPSWHMKRFRTVGWQLAFNVTGVLIILSTLFLRQHSVLDIAGALAICVPAYFICFRYKKSGAAEQ